MCWMLTRAFYLAVKTSYMPSSHSHVCQSRLTRGVLQRRRSKVTRVCTPPMAGNLKLKPQSFQHHLCIDSPVCVNSTGKVSAHNLAADYRQHRIQTLEQCGRVNIKSPTWKRHKKNFPVLTAVACSLPTIGNLDSIQAAFFTAELSYKHVSVCFMCIDSARLERTQTCLALLCRTFGSNYRRAAHASLS